jgi:hypothetical protein
MAVTAEQLNIIIAARDREFARAMDQNVRRIERFSKQTNKGLGDASKSFDMLGSAAKRLAPLLAAAFSVQAVRATFDMAKNLDNLAAVAGVDVERFQELTIGVRQFGVEQEKLADILKDVNDKFGDYMQTGAGPLADFFENIAPKVALTAEAFANLSSEQKLGAYVKALQDANVSQAEMTFYLEALASDATLLQRAFIDSGAAMQPMIDKARSLGLILDEGMVKKGKEAQESLALMSDIINGKLAQALINIAPLLISTASLIETITRGANIVFNLTPEAQAAELRIAQEDYMNQLIAAQAAADRARELVAVGVPGQEYALQRAEEDVAALAAAYEEVTQALRELGGVADGIELGVINAGAGGLATPGFVALSDGMETFVGRMQSVIDKHNEINNLPPINWDNLPGFTPVGPDGAPVLRPPMRPSGLASGGPTGGSTGGRSAIERLPPAIREASDEMIRFQSIMQSVEGSIESAFMAMIDGTMSTKDAFRAMASDIIRELYRVLVVQQMVRGISSAIGLATMGLGGFYASGGTVQAGTPVVTGEHGRELFVPQQDGRIMSAAQTREMMNGGGGGVTINQTINVSTGVQQTVRTEIKSLMPEIAENTKAAVLDAKRRGGSYGRAFA